MPKVYSGKVLRYYLVRDSTGHKNTQMTGLG